MPKKIATLILVCLLVIALAGCAGPEPAEPPAKEEPVEETTPTDTAVPPTEAPAEEEGETAMEMTITSPAFQEGEAIPVQFSCYGENFSPELAWSGVPEGTTSLVFILDDPDAPGGTWVHWVLFNLPAGTQGLDEKFPEDETLADGTRQGITDFGKTGYGGPCPPSGTHRYFFKIYALDKRIDDAAIIDKKKLLKLMEGHIIGQGQLMGKYKRQ